MSAIVHPYVVATPSQSDVQPQVYVQGIGVEAYGMDRTRGRISYQTTLYLLSTHFKNYLIQRKFIVRSVATIRMSRFVSMPRDGTQTHSACLAPACLYNYRKFHYLLVTSAVRTKLKKKKRLPRDTVPTGVASRIQWIGRRCGYKGSLNTTITKPFKNLVRPL